MKKLKMTIAMCLATVMVMSMMCVGVLADEKNTNRSYTELFGNKELLSYFLLTDDLKMQGDLERFIR